MINRKYFTITLLLTSLLFISNSLEAQRIHAIIFAATKDATIGNGTKKSFDLLSQEVENIANQTGITPKLYYRTGDAFTLGSYQSVMGDLGDEDLSNDIVLFYFLGHGYQNESSPYPNLLFQNTSGAISEQQLDESAVDFAEIQAELQKRNARLTILIGEACNNELDLEGIQYASKNDNVSSLTPPLLSEKEYRRLFLEAKGMIVVSSSRSGQPSYISETQGGAFTQSFLAALRRQTQKSNLKKSSWIKLFDDARDRTRSLAEKQQFEYAQMPQFQVVKPVAYEKSTAPEPAGKRPRVTFWTRLVAFVAPNKVEKSFNAAIKQGNLLDLETILARQGEKGDRMKIKMIQKNPVTFYMAQAMIFEEKEDTVKALLNYSIAYELGKGNRTKRDQALIDKIMKLNQKHNMVEGLNEAKNYQTFLRDKLNKHRSYFENDISQSEGNIVAIKNQIEDIETSIQKDRTEIKGIRTDIGNDKSKIKKLQAQISKIDIKRSQKLEVKLGSMQKSSGKTLEKISDLLDKIEREGVVDNQKSVTVDDAVVEFQFAKRNTAASLEPTTTGYQLGKHCTDDIVNTTESLMDILLRPVDKVPNNKKNELSVKVKIIGNADWKGGGKVLNIWYTGEENIFQEYTDKNGETKVFNIDEGIKKRISNEELAFLRAYCSYKIIKRTLEAKGINDYQVQFQAIEHERPEKINKADDPGSEYRGVSIDMSIKNLFKHYLDKIKELESEIEEIKDGLDEKEDAIQSLRSDIVEKEKVIEDKRIAIQKEEERKGNLQEILESAQIKQGLNSQAQREVEKVRQIQLVKN